VNVGAMLTASAQGKIRRNSYSPVAKFVGDIGGVRNDLRECMCCMCIVNTGEGPVAKFVGDIGDVRMDLRVCLV